MKTLNILKNRVRLKKYQYLTIVFLLVVFLFFTVKTTFALELNYPNLGPGRPIIGPGLPTLNQFIAYFFIFSYLAAGIIGVISIAIGGFQYLISSISPEQKNNARDRILNSILGIILLMFSFILLITINPALVNPQTTYTPIQPGLYYKGFVGISDQYPDGYAYKPALLRNDSTSDVVEEFNQLGATSLSLYYYCVPPGKTLLVSVYNQPNFVVDFSANGTASVNTYSLKCGAVFNSIVLSPSSLRSFVAKYEDVGVYFYLQADCRGISNCIRDDSCPQTISGDISNFSSRFPFPSGEPPVRSFRIVNSDNASDITNRQGVILTKQYGGGGECSAPIIKSTPHNPENLEEGCFNVPFSLDDLDNNGSLDDPLNPFYAHIIKQAQWYPRQDRVHLYTSNLYHTFTSTQIGWPVGWYTLEFNPRELFVPREGVSRFVWRPAEDMPPDIFELEPIGCFDGDPATTFPNHICLNYVEPEGEGIFATILYGGRDKERVCRIFYGDIDGRYIESPETVNQDFLDLEFGGKELYRMDIIPHPY